MCGLVGFIGKATKDSDRAFKELLMVDVIRGPHSTGVYGLTRHGTYDVVKKVGLPNELFDSKRYHTMIIRDNFLLMGHNRWATKGKINSTNAHPFEFKDIVGVHNGTLINQRLLPDHTDFEVDSENIYHSIQEDGFATTVGKIHGAYALVWHDERDNSLNFSRNKERTLYYCTNKSSDQLFWASEAWMLTGVLGRNGIQHGKVMSFEVDQHYAFDMDNFGTFQQPSIPKPSVRKAVGYIPPPVVKKTYQKWINKSAGVVATQGKKQHKLWDKVVFTVSNNPGVKGGSVFVEGTTDLGETVSVYLTEVLAAHLDVFVQGTKLTGTINSAPADHDKGYRVNPATVRLVAPAHKSNVTKMVAGYRGELISEHEFRKRVAKGCAWCSDIAGEGMVWLSSEEFLCDTCSQDEAIFSMAN